MFDGSERRSLTKENGFEGEPELGDAVGLEETGVGLSSADEGDAVTVLNTERLQ